jgi:hypothetical protein
LPSSIKLTIDLTKLARIAESKNKKNLAAYLIEKEENLDKRI